MVIDSGSTRKARKTTAILRVLLLSPDTDQVKLHAQALKLTTGHVHDSTRIWNLFIIIIHSR